MQRSPGPASVVAESAPRVGARVAGCAPASPKARLVAGRYRLRALLGRGGMGRVWLADDELLHRPVALKQDLQSDPTANAARSAPDRLVVEACAAANVNHSGAVTIYDVVIDDGQNWIVMEPLFGPTLGEMISVQGHLPVPEVAAIGLRLLTVLDAAHRVGIVHCDVKPANVHVCDDGRVVLTDFGIAHKMLDEADGTTQIFAGSPVYAAPEVLRGRDPEPASDLFSLGATLFAAVEGKPPFHGTSLFDAVVAVVNGEPAPFLHAGPLRPVLDGLLAKQPGDRLTADQTRVALWDIQHEAQLRAGSREREQPPWRFVPRLHDEILGEFA